MILVIMHLGPENAIAAASQDSFEGDYLVKFWRTTDGLPQDSVNALLQTRDGFLWVGTGAGLARFDGLVFSKPDHEDAQWLADAAVTALAEDGQGGLWVATQSKGVLRLRQGRVERFTTQQGLAGDNVTSLAEDQSGAIWIGTQAGLNRWVDGRLSRFTAPTIPEGDSIVALHAGRSGSLWITTRSGVFCVRKGAVVAFKSDQVPQGRNAELVGAYEDRSGNLWVFGATFLLNVTQGPSLNTFSSLNLSSSRVWTICEPNNGDFWIGTSGQGLFRFQNGRFEIAGAREGLDQCEIRALHADRWGNLWIGTGDKGLACLRSRRVRFVGADVGLASQNVSAIASDGASGLWVGTTDSGLWHWDGHRAEPWSGGGPLARATQIQTLCLDSRTNLWVGTAGAGLLAASGQRQLRLTTADGLCDDTVLAVAASAAEDAVWAGTQAGGLHRIRAGRIDTPVFPSAVPRSPIRCLLEGQGGRLWIGLQEGGLIEWDGTDLEPVAAPAELAARPVRSLYLDRKARLWVGTWGGGAFCRSGDSWIPISRGHGLNLDNVGMITESDGRVFWIGTAENLFKARSVDVESFLDRTRERIDLVPAVASLDGLKGPRGWPASARCPDGKLWLAGRSELFPVDEAENPSAESAPPVVLERVLVNGHAEPAPMAGPLKLGPGTRSLDFEFTAISFTASQKLRFRYMLENSDPGWVEAGGARRAHYGPVPAGRYRFRVTAANEGGIWNEAGAGLELVITPPVWRAWWFLTAIGGLLAAGIWAIARSILARRWRKRLQAIEQRHAMERERARIAQDMHDEIGSKLTRISFLSEIARQSAGDGRKPSPPVEAIASTSRELLQSLDEIVWAVNPRNDNLEQLAGYLEQHAREYFQGTECECKIQVPPQLPEAMLTAELRHNVFLAFEEALNNSLKHARARNVAIAMRVNADRFEISVQDDGCGFNPTAAERPEHDGLRNMKQRLHAVGGTCDISSQPGSGTRVLIKFPLTQAGSARMHGMQSEAAPLAASKP